MNKFNKIKIIMKENNDCKHEELEKINNKLYICKNCSLFGIIKELTTTEAKIKLLSKPFNYNIKNEINIYDIAKNAIKYYIDNTKIKIDVKKDDKYISNLELYLKFRKKLIKHIYNLCSGINTTYECYYLSIELMDNVINNLDYIIDNFQLDLISTACFIISKKFIEKDLLQKESYKDYLTICHSPQKFIKPVDLIFAEVECLKQLKYNLNISTSLSILKYIFVCGIIFTHEIEENEIKIIYDICFDILKYCIEQDEIYKNYNAVQLVFGIVYLVRKKYNLKKNISKYFYDIFDIKFSYIKECIKLIEKLYYKDNNNNQNGKNKILNLENNNKSINTENNIKNEENKVYQHFSQKKDIIPKNYYFSPIIKSTIFSIPIIKNIEFGSATRLKALNLDDLDKKSEDNIGIKSIIIVKNENKKTNRNNKKYQFFRSSKHKRKEYSIDIKNCSSSPNSSSTIDVEANIEKEKSNSFNILIKESQNIEN